MIPKPLPTRAYEFQSFCDQIFSRYSIPDDPSYRVAIGTAILHLKSTQDRMAPYYFARVVRKAMANQTAFEMSQAIKKAEKQKQAEAPAPVGLIGEVSKQGI